MLRAKRIPFATTVSNELLVVFPISMMQPPLCAMKRPKSTYFSIVIEISVEKWLENNWALAISS